MTGEEEAKPSIPKPLSPLESIGEGSIPGYDHAMFEDGMFEIVFNQGEVTIMPVARAERAHAMAMRAAYEVLADRA